MFRLPIQGTAFTTDVADGYFSNICGCPYKTDVTFLSTLRALIAPRMSENESLNLLFGSSSYSKGIIEEYPPKQIFSSMLNSINLNIPGLVYIHSLTAEQEGNTACLDVLKSNFTKIYKGWHRLTKVSDLFRNQFYVLCFVNPELKSVCLFVDNLGISKLHYLQCGILGFFPWYFSPEKGITQEEMDLLNALRGKEPNDYLRCISRIAEKYDFRTDKIKRQLAGFETRFEKQECAETKSNIDRIDSDINRLNDQISTYLRNRRDLEIKLLGLEEKIAEGGENSEIMEYFIHNHKLELDYANDENISFIVKDYISYFDEDMAKRAIDNPNSFVYCPDGRLCNEYIKGEKVKELMYAIFVDQSIKIKVCAAYTFSLTGQVYGVSGYNFGAEYDEYMPNPHIQNHSCMGNYSRPINECLARHDYISALEQTIASAKSLNFGDSIVMKGFMRLFYGLGDGASVRARRRWLEMPDGTLMTSAEAADLVWSQNHPEEQEENSNE